MKHGPRHCQDQGGKASQHIETQTSLGVYCWLRTGMEVLMRRLLVAGLGLAIVVAAGDGVQAQQDQVPRFEYEPLWPKPLPTPWIFGWIGGLSVDETARLLDVSAGTVKRDWRMAKAWLARELSVSPPEER